MKKLLLVIVLILVGSYIFYSFNKIEAKLYNDLKKEYHSTKELLDSRTIELEIITYAYNKLPSEGKNVDLLNQVRSKFPSRVIDSNITATLLGKGK